MIFRIEKWKNHFSHEFPQGPLWTSRTQRWQQVLRLLPKKATHVAKNFIFEKYTISAFKRRISRPLTTFRKKKSCFEIKNGEKCRNVHLIDLLTWRSLFIWSKTNIIFLILFRIHYQCFFALNQLSLFIFGQMKKTRFVKSLKIHNSGQETSRKSISP